MCVVVFFRLSGVRFARSTFGGAGDKIDVVVIERRDETIDFFRSYFLVGKVADDLVVAEVALKFSFLNNRFEIRIYLCHCESPPALPAR